MAATRLNGLPSSPAPGSDEHEPPTATRAPLTAFVAVAVGSAALLAAMSYRVFLFWDDFVFLGDARRSPLTWDYLKEPLFTHFSPVVRLGNWLTVGHIPDQPWIIPAVVLLLLAAVVASSTWLLVVLFGRTWTTLVGCLVLGVSLSLVPLGIWWTAALNFLPAIVGCQVAFAAMVLIVRGRSLLWAVPCLVGIVIGVLDYELAMLMPGYLGLWLLLFRGRVTEQPLLAVLRRTWWLWVALIAISAVSLLNYRLNYYYEVAAPTPADAVNALAISLFRTLVPSAIGVHDPATEWFATLGLVVGMALLVALFVVTMIRRRGGWRGWLFAVAGWLLPTLALVLNRVGIQGMTVVDNAIYFYFPTMLFVIGVLEALHAPIRSAGNADRVHPVRRRRIIAVAGVAAVLAAALGYVKSAPPTAAYQLPYQASGSYVERARESAAGLRASIGDFSVIDGDVPGRVVPDFFEARSNRAGNVLGITVPGLQFDAPTGPYYVVDDAGDLRQVQVEDQFVLPFEPGATDGLLSITGVDDQRYEPGRGSCFVSRAESEVAVQLPETIVGDRLVVRTMAGVDAITGARVEIVPTPGTDPERANDDGHQWFPDQQGRLDTVRQPSIDSLLIRGMTPGVAVCISSISVGSVSVPQ